MTAKEKANSLFNSFLTDSFDGLGYYDRKNCAKRDTEKAVNQVIDAIKSIIGHQSHMWSVDQNELMKYWQEVKNELSKL